tara:strand:+ start:73 stop:393 length:321 start_codon:yes stop_codon:yes gene_type:complete
MKKLIPLILLTVLTGCISGNSTDYSDYSRGLEITSDFRICQLVYPGFESNYLGALRSIDFRIKTFEFFEIELNRRNLVCSERFPSYDEFKGKSQLQLLKEKKLLED